MIFNTCQKNKMIAIMLLVQTGLTIGLDSLKVKTKIQAEELMHFLLDQFLTKKLKKFWLLQRVDNHLIKNCILLSIKTCSISSRWCMGADLQLSATNLFLNLKSEKTHLHRDKKESKTKSKHDILQKLIMKVKVNTQIRHPKLP